MSARMLGVAVLAALAAAGCGGDGGGTARDAVADDAARMDVPAGDEATGTDADRDLAAQETGGDATSDAAGEDPAAGDEADGEAADAATDPVADPAAEDATEDADTNPCPRLPGAADRARVVAVSFPYLEGARKSGDWALLQLAADGTLSGPGPRFQMGPAFDGEVAFTPDGEIGIAVQDDGTLGVFRVAGDGTAQVVHAAFAGHFYASRIVMSAAGDHAFVLDTEWRDSGGSTRRGGGVYRVDIGCDGTLTDRGMAMPAKLPAALLAVPGQPGRAVLAARDVLDVMSGGDLHLLSSEDAPTVVHSAAALSEDSSVDGSAMTPDGKFALLGDSGMFSTQGVGVVEVAGDTLVPRQFLSGIGNPAAIVVSPSGGTALVAGAYEPDDLWILDRDDAHPEAPFSIRGTVEYAGGGSQLPTSMVMLERGPLAGRVLVTEVTGIRQIDLATDGSVVDHGVFPLGGGVTNMPAVIGVQP